MSRDVAQDVFLAAWRDLRKLRNPASFLPWLRQLARNRAHHVLRSRARARRHEADAVADDYLQAINDPRPNATAQLVAREEADALAAALDALPDDTAKCWRCSAHAGIVAKLLLLLASVRPAKRPAQMRTRSRVRVTMRNASGSDVFASSPAWW